MEYLAWLGFRLYTENGPTVADGIQGAYMSAPYLCMCLFLDYPLAPCAPYIPLICMHVYVSLFLYIYIIPLFYSCL